MIQCSIQQNIEKEMNMPFSLWFSPIKFIFIIPHKSDIKCSYIEKQKG